MYNIKRIHMNTLEHYLNKKYSAGYLSIESLRRELLMSVKQVVPGAGRNEFFTISEAAKIIERA